MAFPLKRIQENPSLEEKLNYSDSPVNKKLDLSYGWLRPKVVSWEGEGSSGGSYLAEILPFLARKKHFTAGPDHGPSLLLVKNLPGD